jgi:hypothetical protein
MHEQYYVGLDLHSNNTFVGVLDGLMGAGFTVHLGNPVAFQ